MICNNWTSKKPHAIQAEVLTSLPYEVEVDHEDEDTDYNGIGGLSNNDPRYTHLQTKQCEHKITVMRNSTKGVGQTVLDWISENVSAPWSVHHYFDKSIFSFSDLQEATLFRLRF